MLAVRLYVHLRSPFPSVQPVQWLAFGLAEDLAIAALGGALFLAAARFGRSDAWTRVAFSALALGLLVAQIVWSEVLVFFGDVPSRDELLAGTNLTFARGSVAAPALASAALVLLLFGFLLYLAARRAKNARSGWSSALRLSIIASAAGAASFVLPVPVHRRETTRNALVAQVRILRQGPPSDSTGVPAFPEPRVDPAAIRELAPDAPPREYLGAEFPLAHRALPRSQSAPTLVAGLRPNLVFLLLESVRAEEVGAYGGNPAGVTPNLDRLAREGVLVEQAYCTGLQTPDAELALWYGIYPNPYALVITRDPRAKLTGLPELLRSSGWRSLLFIHNGDQTFYRRVSFYRPRGFQTIDGSDFPRDDPRTGWGYSDRALARRAVETLDRAREPFAALALTVSNHHPFQVPADAHSHFPLLPGPRRGFLTYLGLEQPLGLQTGAMVQTIHYTDEAIGEFFRLASSRNWYPRTVFVITGDHGLSILPYKRPINTVPALTELRHRVPLIFYSPMLAPARVRGPASHVDVPETLLGLAGIELPRSGVGRDLLDPGQLDPEHPVLAWSAPGRRITVLGQRSTYQASLAGEAHSPKEVVPLSEEILFDRATDPDGTRNLLALEPRLAERFRRLAQIFVEINPWLVFADRSGAPSPAFPEARGSR
jgi:arylsulfatase A-like enzyme